MAILPGLDAPKQLYVSRISGELEVLEFAEVSEEEYLTTRYEPDCDYVDGRIEVRNLGERDHAFLQSIISSIFITNRKIWGVSAATDWRVQVKRTNYRVPDVTVLPVGSGREPICNHPPLLVIEILSPEDRMNKMVKRCQDYVAFGIKNIWIIDPQRRCGFYVDAAGVTPAEAGELIVAGTPVRVGLGELFAELDEI